MYNKFFKLINGDDVVAQTEDSCESFLEKEFIEVNNPIIINQVKVPRGPFIMETFVMKPWVTFSKSNTVRIPTRCIVTTTDLHELVEEQYIKYVDIYFNKNSEKPEPETKEDNQEPSIETLEEFIRNISELTEEEDDERYTRTRFTRTIH